MLSRVGRFIRRKHEIHSARKSRNGISPHHLERLLIAEDKFCVGGSGKEEGILRFLGWVERVTGRDPKMFKDLFVFCGDGEGVHCVDAVVLVPLWERAHQKAVHTSPVRDLGIRCHCSISKVRQIGGRIVLPSNPKDKGLPQCRIGRHGPRRRHRSRWLCRWFAGDITRIQEP